MVNKWIQDDIESFLEVLPERVLSPLRAKQDIHELLEVVLDLGRPTEARFTSGDVILDNLEVTQTDLDYVVTHVGEFGDDNRAGIARTLHRISAVRNRKDKIVGLTCRVGRAVFGTIRIVEDLVLTGKSILLLGRPGVGKTTMLREVARVLADEAKMRVIVVDTSNEIAGAGDIPHPGIGHARRMQVKTPALQHAVMIEAVENHMPEVIIIDEMGTEQEAAAARTIAERGVQLVATAHGNTLENLILNPTLSDLVGGVQVVTLGDEEARRRGTRKTTLERKAPPTFDIVIEIQNWEKVAVHDNVAEVVDLWLRGYPPVPEQRWIGESGQVHKTRDISPSRRPVSVARPTPEETHNFVASRNRARESAQTDGQPPRILLFGVGRDKLMQSSLNLSIPIEVAETVPSADMVLTTKAHYRRGDPLFREAQDANKPVYVLRKNSLPQVQQFLRSLGRSKGYDESDNDIVNSALAEAHEAVQRLLGGERSVILSPQRAYIRRLQHILAEKYNLTSVSVGSEPGRRVTYYKR